MHSELGLLANLSVSLVLALILGLIAQRMRLSPIVGYLLAGILLGPQTPGFVGDAKMASELAEIGVVLLMFGVGLHFKLEDLLAVRRIALPGSVTQFIVATTLIVLVTLATGIGLSNGLVLGAAVSIASTVVVIRVLMENDALHSPPGHITVGWLIAQDIFTVLVLVAMPALGSLLGEGKPTDQSLWFTLLMAAGRVALLVFVVVVGGRRFVPWLLRIVTKTRSRELFTLSILAIALAVALGSSVIFGVSMALGAFLAGMAVGQSEASHQAAADALPMRDAFAVLFFVSVGMLVDYKVILERPLLLCVLLAVVLVVNPVSAFVITWTLRYSISTCLTVAALLCQIGEFSFLLANQAVNEKLLFPEGHSLLVICAIVTIAVNPLIYQGVKPLEKWLKSRGALWKALSHRSESIGRELNHGTQELLNSAHNAENKLERAVIIGYGPVGQTAQRILEEFEIQPVIVDLNLDTVRRLNSEGKQAIYGDAGQRDILLAAGIMQARYLLITVPEVFVRSLVTLLAKELNPDIRVFVRAHYINERSWLEEVGATGIVTEEGEIAVSLAVMLLEEMGANKDRIRAETRRIQQQLRLRG